MYVNKNVVDFTWRVSDCEELVGHLGIYSPNYFMYDKRGQCAPPYPSLLKFRQLLHLNQSGVQNLISYLADTQPSEL